MEKLDELIDKLFDLREQRRELDQKVAAVNEQIEEHKLQLLDRFRETGTDYARGSLASATRTEMQVPKIEDWGKVSQWVMENNGLYLLHRRVSAGPWKELLDAGTEVPGIEPFTKIDISLRKRGN